MALHSSLQRPGITWAQKSGPRLSGASLHPRRESTRCCAQKSTGDVSSVASSRSQERQQAASSNTSTLALACSAAVVATALAPHLPAEAFEIHTEPANALSLPTWAIHVSSVVEWIAAMTLMWKYAEVSGNEKWKGMTWGMLPSLVSAMCACTWHFFYNSPDLEFLVALQSFFTVVGNTTCWIAAYRIYADSKAPAQ